MVTDEFQGNCDECGGPFTIDCYGIATHDDNLDADRDHVPYSRKRRQ